jgi:hypothetical protein
MSIVSSWADLATWEQVLDKDTYFGMNMAMQGLQIQLNSATLTTFEAKGIP